MVLVHPPLPSLPSHSGQPRPVAVITGSSQGLGLAIALRLADDGCDIVVNDLPSKIRPMEDAVRRITSKGVRATVVAADVSSEDEVKRLVEVTVEKFGKLDIVRPSPPCPRLNSCWLIYPGVDGGERRCSGYETTSSKLRDNCPPDSQSSYEISISLPSIRQ